MSNAILYLNGQYVYRPELEESYFDMYVPIDFIIADALTEVV